MTLPGFHITRGSVWPFYHLACEQQKQNKCSRHVACLLYTGGQIKELTFTKILS